MLPVDMLSDLVIRQSDFLRWKYYHRSKVPECSLWLCSRPWSFGPGVDISFATHFGALSMECTERIDMMYIRTACFRLCS